MTDTAATAPPVTPSVTPSPAVTRPSPTDRYVSQLATPFSGKETRDLLANKSDDIPVGNGIHIEMIAVLFSIFVFMLFLLIMLGILYNKYFKDRRNPYKNKTPEEKKELGDEFIYNDYQYTNVVSWVIGLVGLILIWFFTGRWVLVYDVTLRKQNSIAENIAVAMRTDAAISNVSRLLAASVHPLDNKEAKTARDILYTHLNTAVRNGFKYEINAEKTKLNLNTENVKPPPGRWNSLDFRKWGGVTQI